ncbi:hypothetical protein Pelo_4110 [Pelomyxa schiedti]|nr:hypothetical protein Pelo_4110 [Pelomyxa schiedti]
MIFFSDVTFPERKAGSTRNCLEDENYGYFYFLDKIEEALLPHPEKKNKNRSKQHSTAHKTKRQDNDTDIRFAPRSAYFLLHDLGRCTRFAPSPPSDDRPANVDLAADVPSHQQASRKQAGEDRACFQAGQVHFEADEGEARFQAGQVHFEADEGQACFQAGDFQAGAEQVDE